MFAALGLVTSCSLLEVPVRGDETAAGGLAPRQVFVIQLEEARAEQERRKTTELPTL